LKKHEKKINVSRETLSVFFILISMLHCFVGHSWAGFVPGPFNHSASVVATGNETI
jgi:hypothetical protein